MEHKVNLEEISDGKLYRLNDMIRLGCDGCNGAASCCRFAEDTITLDPYDIYELSLATGLTFEQLYAKQWIALSPSNGLLLPHLNFALNDGVCPFLDRDGLCQIHAHRPGLCRLFPLARLFQDDTLYYIHQIHECPNTVAPKTKIKKWLGVTAPEAYEHFLIRWNRILTNTKTAIQKAADNAALTATTTTFLKTYYFTPYDTTQEFYPQFEVRDR